jgi:hypothetical protein
MNIMKQSGIFVVLIALAACDPMQADPAPGPALDLSETGQTNGDGTNTAFARSAAARYAGKPPADILNDLIAQGFSCDAAAMSCMRNQLDEACADSWIVDVEADGGASGRLVRRCFGAMEDDE